MSKATTSKPKFSVSDLSPDDMKIIQHEIVKRLATKQGTNLSPHDSHSSSHGKNSVQLKASLASKAAKVSKAAKGRVGR